jgi:hypothetical protein
MLPTLKKTADINNTDLPSTCTMFVFTLFSVQALWYQYWVFLYVTTYSLVDGCQCFGKKTCYLGFLITFQRAAPLRRHIKYEQRLVIQFLRSEGVKSCMAITVWAKGKSKNGWKDSKDVGWLLFMMRVEPIDVNLYREKEVDESAYPGQLKSRSW